MILDKMETIVIGARHRFKTDPNSEQKAFVSKGLSKYEGTPNNNYALEYRQKSKVNCERNVPWYHKGWSVCMVNRMGAKHDKFLHGDSGYNFREFSDI